MRKKIGRIVFSVFFTGMFSGATYAYDINKRNLTEEISSIASTTQVEDQSEAVEEIKNSADMLLIQQRKK